MLKCSGIFSDDYKKYICKDILYSQSSLYKRHNIEYSIHHLLKYVWHLRQITENLLSNPEIMLKPIRYISNKELDALCCRQLEHDACELYVNTLWMLFSYHIPHTIFHIPYTKMVPLTKTSWIFFKKMALADPIFTVGGGGG